MCLYTEDHYYVCGHWWSAVKPCTKRCLQRKFSNVRRPSVSLFRSRTNSATSTAATTDSSNSPGLTSGPEVPLCDPVLKEIGTTNFSDICPACISTFETAAVDHKYAMLRVKDWRNDTGYGQLTPIKLAVDDNGLVVIRAYTPDEQATLERVYMNTRYSSESPPKSDTPTTTKNVTADKPRKNSLTPWRTGSKHARTNPRVAHVPKAGDLTDGFENIELSENFTAAQSKVDAAREKEKGYVNWLRTHGEADAEAERKDREAQDLQAAREREVREGVERMRIRDAERKLKEIEREEREAERERERERKREVGEGVERMRIRDAERKLKEIERQKREVERVRRRAEVKTQREAGLFANADPRARPDSDFVRGVGQVKARRRAPAPPAPPPQAPTRRERSEDVFSRGWGYGGMRTGEGEGRGGGGEAGAAGRTDAAPTAAEGEPFRG